MAFPDISFLSIFSPRFSPFFLPPTLSSNPIVKSCPSSRHSKNLLLQKRPHARTRAASPPWLAAGFSVGSGWVAVAVKLTGWQASEALAGLAARPIPIGRWPARLFLLLPLAIHPFHPPSVRPCLPPGSPSRHCRIESFLLSAREREQRVDGDVGVGCDDPDNARRIYNRKDNKENMRTVCGLCSLTRYSLSSPIQSNPYIHQRCLCQKSLGGVGQRILERTRKKRGWWCDNRFRRA